ncbi:hypothetical protein PIB30_100867, partial [Stylosanthes scabra]|nr:hypothetical protein [Stylosanthes scabra]
VTVEFYGGELYGVCYSDAATVTCWAIMGSKTVEETFQGGTNSFTTFEYSSITPPHNTAGLAARTTLSRGLSMLLITTHLNKTDQPSALIPLVGPPWGAKPSERLFREEPSEGTQDEKTPHATQNLKVLNL